MAGDGVGQSGVVGGDLKLNVKQPVTVLSTGAELWRNEGGAFASDTWPGGGPVRHVSAGSLRICAPRRAVAGGTDRRSG